MKVQFLNGNTGFTEPWQGTKNQRYEVKVTLPYNNVRITNLNLLSIINLESAVQWVSMADDPFTVNTTLPTWTPLP